MIKLGPREPSEKQVADIVVRLQSLFERLPTSQCYVYGSGGQPKGLYQELANTRGTVLKSLHSVLPQGIAIIGAIIPSYAGLVRVASSAALPESFSSIAESSSAGVYFLIPENGEKLERLVAARTSLAEIEQFIETDEHTIAYQLDTNNASSRSDMFDWLFLGESVAAEIRDELTDRGGWCAGGNR